jgi:hypothetical protein
MTAELAVARRSTPCWPASCPSGTSWGASTRPTATAPGPARPPRRPTTGAGGRRPTGRRRRRRSPPAPLRRPRDAQSSPGAHRAAQLRHHRPRGGRPLPRPRRLPGLRDLPRHALERRRRDGQGSRACAAAAAPAFPPGRSGGSAARPRRRALPHLQRRRGRPRRVHEPLADRGRPARRARGHADRRLRHRRLARLRLHPGGVPAGHPAPALGHRGDAKLGLLGDTSWAPTSRSTSRSRRAPGLSSAARRRP